MLTKDFYKIVDSQINNLLKDYKDNEFIKKYPKQESKNSFGFLIWFLNRYYPLGNNYEECITEGDGDNSCDIIFNNTDNIGNNVYYVIQAKWFKESNISSTNQMSKEVKACISDFRTILKGQKQLSDKNVKFNEKYKELLKHKHNRGIIKFVFVALCKGSEQAADNISEFKTNLTDFNIVDINRLKRDYIELEYKEAKTHNPLETPYEPKGDIFIKVESENYIEISKPHPAYIFVVKPETIYELFQNYQYSLFYKNIRNPLFNSDFNLNIIKTLENNPLNFWYFNNGITGITDNIEDFHPDNDEIRIKGLQIINGAQTVFSIYEAFNSLDSTKREMLNRDVKISFRIMKTGGRDFDLDVTRYTNSQNPVTERDFHSNDEVQINLQNKFLDNTNIWYERRASEYRKKLNSIWLISNEKFAQTYLAFNLQDPVKAKNDVQFFFVSSKNNGLYDTIFNDKTKYDVMQASYYLFFLIENKKREKYKEIKSIEHYYNKKYNEKELNILNYQFVIHASFHILALMKVVYEENSQLNYKGVIGKIISDFNNKNNDFFDRMYILIIDKIKKYIIDLQSKDLTFSLSKYFKSTNSHDELNNLFK